MGVSDMHSQQPHEENSLTGTGTVAAEGVVGTEDQSADQDAMMAAWEAFRAEWETGTVPDTGATFMFKAFVSGWQAKP